MTNRELAEILLRSPENEVFIINYNSKIGEDLRSIEHIYEDEPGRTVLSFD